MSLEPSRRIEDLARRFRPSVPPDELIRRLNRIYHAVEAQAYDHTHPEIDEQLPPIWNEMIDRVRPALGTRRLRILDFGCGTGFATRCLLAALPRESIAALVCCDPSPEMLGRCRSNVVERHPEARFVASLDELEPDLRFDLLATNAVLHHLPDYARTLAALAARTPPGAVWLAGHEPSSRFFSNPECARAYEAYRRADRLRKLASPRAIGVRVARLLGLPRDPAARAAREAFRAGLFARRPDPGVVARLVDLHVAHSAAETGRGWGLDPGSLEGALADWEPWWVKTYSFMGPVWEGHLPPRWRRVAESLAARFPDDGASFSSVWRRRATRADTPPPARER